MNDYKIIIAGPAGSGKTTAIATLSDEVYACTNQSAYDMAHVKKSETTVTMDYGTISIGGQEKVHFYSTPRHERFDFMRDDLTTNGLGLILLLDNTRRDPLNDLAFHLKSFKDYINKTALAIGITKTDIAPLLKMDQYHKTLKEAGFNGAIYEIDTRSFNDMSQLVQALLFTINPGLECSA